MNSWHAVLVLHLFETKEFFEGCATLLAETGGARQRVVRNG